MVFIVQGYKVFVKIASLSRKLEPNLTHRITTLTVLKLFSTYQYISFRHFFMSEIGDSLCKSFSANYCNLNTSKCLSDPPKKFKTRTISDLTCIFHSLGYHTNDFNTLFIVLYVVETSRYFVQCTFLICRNYKQNPEI